MKVFAGSASIELGKRICARLGIELGESKVIRYSDGEITPKFCENLRGERVFLVQSTPPPAESWLELFLMIDAAKRASSAEINVVMPYAGYSRMERKDEPRVSISAAALWGILGHLKVDRIIAMDLHSNAIQGFFTGPVDHLYSRIVFLPFIKKGVEESRRMKVAAADEGGLKVVRAIADRVGVEVVLVYKGRPAPNRSEVMFVIGDVEGYDIWFHDDILDTAGTLCNAVKAVKDKGARKVYCSATHALLSGDAIERLTKSEIEHLWVSDTINRHERIEKLKENWDEDKVTVVETAPLLAEVIRQVDSHGSVSSLFN